MLTLKEVSKNYGEKDVLNNVNINLPEGKMVCLLGKNGIGKSTLVKIITGILIQDKGTVEIGGYNIIDNPIEYKSKFGYVSDDYNNFLNLTAIEYLNFIADIYDIEQDVAEEKIGELAEYLEIKKDLNQRISTYSKGMKQKIMIIGSIIHSPDILILDEPFNGLDPESVYKVKELLKSLTKKNKTVLFSTHILEIAENLSDIVLILHDKNIVSNLDMKVFSENKNNNLEKIFLDITKSKQKEY